jgi:putative DNA primase/helicase
VNQIQEYLEHGFALVPIPRGKKGPRGEGWNLSENVVTRIEQLARIRRNVGLAHAHCSPSPTAALDVDDQALAAEWLRERGQDLDLLLDAPDAVQIISGRANSSKLLYRLPLGIAPMTTLQIKDPKTKTMVLEFRCASANGRTVQDVLPPSMHPETGQQYQWGGSGDWQSLPTMPQSLLGVWQQELKLGAGRRSPEVDCRASKAVEDTPRKRAMVGSMLDHITPDCSYDQYRDMVWAILSLGWADGFDVARAWCLRAPHRFNEGCFHSLIAGYDESRGPSYGTIHYHAKEGGWHE